MIEIATPNRLTLGYSPCPNDTFIFHGIVGGAVTIPGVAIVEELHDVETLNEMAMSGRLDITKLSFHAWLKVRRTYRLLQTGAALGFGCGPILISTSRVTRSDMAGCRVVLPGRWTTAHLLFRLWAPEAGNRYFTTYDRIFEEVSAGRADCGVIIHENRFTFEQAGFRAVVDLGAWWEQETGMPIPLGCIAAKADLDGGLIDTIEALIRRSLTTASDNPEAVLPYIRRHAREMDGAVLRRHIRTFVNRFTLNLGAEGRSAVDELARRARAAGVIA